MSTNPDFERLLDRIDASRREAVRKILAGAAIYTAPMIASYSMDSLEGVAHAQAPNQTIGPPVPIPATSGWTLAALAGALAAAGAFVLRRRRAK
jgi:LPXTG-motif cell wall-anchored protein